MLSAFFVGLSILTFFVFQPFLRIIVLAIVLSILFHPLYKRFVKIFHGSTHLAAGLIVVIALIFVIIPILLFGLQILDQAQGFFSLTQAGQADFLLSLQQNIDALVQHVVPSFSFQIGDSVTRVQAFISDNLGSLLSQTMSIFFQTFFLLIAFFFFVRNGDRMLDSLVSLSPFSKEQNDEIVSSVYRTTTSLIREMFCVGLIRFALITGAFYLLGIPDAFLWGSIGGIIGVIPGLGTPFAIIPAVIYLALYGNIFMALGMALFGILLFFFVDNLLSTLFFGKDWNVPSVFILFSILGGIIFFGPLGFIFGPIILSLFISTVDMYKILILKRK